MQKWLILFLSLTCFTIQAQDTEAEILEHALSEARRMSKSFLDRDFNSFVDLTHPRLVEAMGGKQAMIDRISQPIGEGVEILSQQVLKVVGNLIKTDESYQCAFKQKMVLKMQGTDYYTNSSLIGISYDEGATWVFIGVSGRTLGEMQEFFTELSDDLQISPQTRPMPVEN